MRKHLYYIVCWILIPAVLGAVTLCVAAETKTVALIPFKVNAEKDMSFLQDGIYDMFSTRLAREGEVRVLPRKQVEQAITATGASESMTEAAARQIGRNLGADYVLFGSLTVVGNSASIDTKMVDVAATRPTLSFFDQSEDMGGVITKINLIAADINAKLFGRATVAQTAPPAGSPGEAATAAPETDQPDIRTHPEKLFKSGGLTGGPGSESILEAAEGQAINLEFWKSSSFKYLANGMAMGDVDGDKLIETVVAGPHEIFVYRSQKGRFFKLKELTGYSMQYIVGVDVADINSNGYDEIFVTSMDLEHNGINSFVLEYDGKDYVEIVSGSSWYYRVADLKNRGKILLGQEHRLYKPFAGDIYEMLWRDGNYVPDTQLRANGPVNLLGATVGDVLEKGAENVVAYSEGDYLQVFESSGNLAWKDDEPLGGSTLYYKGPREDMGDTINRIYLPIRLIVRSGADDADAQVLTAKNLDFADRRLQYRNYTKSFVVSYSWNGLGLVTNWKTRRISGCIRDLGVADFDNDGVLEIVAAVVQSEGTMITTSPKSTLIAYDLPAAPKE